MKNLFIFIMALLTFSASTAEFEVPSKEYPILAIDEYGWLVDYDQLKSYFILNETAERFISKSELERYVKLKMRNFVSKLKFSDERVNGKFSFNYLTVALELYKYNKAQEIYTGLISLRVSASVERKERVGLYKITKSIAGSDNQILRFIKEDIDFMIEHFAEDYYFVSDEAGKSQISN